MKKTLLSLISILSILSFNATAQWTPVTHTTGTATVAGVSTTVSTVGGLTGGGCGGLYWATTTGSSYTFNFSPAVDAVYIQVDALDPTEIMAININGSPYPIANCNLNPTPFVNVCSQTNCNIVGGQFANNTGFAICGGIMVFYGPISSFSIQMVSSIPAGPGTTFNLSIAPGVSSSNSPVCEGNTINLTSNPFNPASPLLWTGPAGFTSTQQNPSIPNATLAMSGDYILETTTPCGPIKDTVPVTVLVNPPAPTLSSNSPVCQGYPINLTATNVPVGTITWNGPNSFTSASLTPIIPGAQAGNAGVYTAFVTNGVCVSPTSTTTVIVNPIPLAPPAPHIEICQYSPMPPLTAAGQSLLWYTTQTGGVGSPVTPTPSNATPGVMSYWVTQTVNGCESPRTQVNITVKPKPIAPFYTGPTHYCRDEPSSPMTLTGSNIQWYDANQNPIVSAPTVNTSVPGDYTWYADQTHDGCTSDKATITIHVADIPPAPVVADVTQCQYDDRIQLTGIGTALKWYDVPVGGSPYLIAPNTNTDFPGVTTWYVSQTIDGCEGPRSPQVVTINYVPTSTFVASRPLVCENDTLTFTYTGNGTVSDTYTWTLPADDSVVLLSGTTDNPNPLVIRFDETGEYPITLTVNNQNCQTTTTYNVKVVLVPVVTVGAPSDICVHDTVKIGLSGYNTPLATYQWDFGGGVNVFNNSGNDFYQIRWDNAGQYEVNVLVSNTACTGTAKDTVVVHDAPNAQFSIVSAGKICIGDSIRLAASDNNGVYSYEWAPERFFNTDNNFAPVVNAYIVGDQAISLTVRTPWGCEATHENAINPEKCCVVSLPNVFTPNGDGKNDIFKPITVGTHSIKKFLIVNRWGQKVFETQNEYEGWDGTFKGADQNMDTYFWVLQYKCDGKEQEQKGEVIILR